MKFLSTLGFITIMALSVIWHGYVISKLWSWFVVSAFALPHLGIMQGVGLALTVGFLTGKYKPSERKPNGSLTEQLTDTILSALLQPGFALLFGWVYQMFL